MNFFAHILARQFRRPSGLLALYAVRFMEKNNRARIERAIDKCEIREADTVLEIGFGPGIGIALAAQRLKSGKIFGLDFSRSMVKKASRRSRQLIKSGKAELMFGDMDPAPFPDNFFDRIFAVNVVYFWPLPERELGEIFRMLKPGGRAVLYFSDRLAMDTVPYTNTGVFRKYTAEEFLPVMQRGGFKTVTCESAVETRAGREMLGHCFVAEK
ncbi:MAG TPA: class I SAM-dependent methyltransferase [Chitinivibrionales bacterium]|nr:class I SAM-dependent methyltransferase [Chitinivibrionales bacterium]